MTSSKTSIPSVFSWWGTDKMCSYFPQLVSFSSVKHWTRQDFPWEHLFALRKPCSAVSSWGMLICLAFWVVVSFRKGISELWKVAECSFATLKIRRCRIVKGHELEFWIMVRIPSGTSFVQSTLLPVGLGPNALSWSITLGLQLLPPYLTAQRVGSTEQCQLKTKAIFFWCCGVEPVALCFTIAQRP